MGKKYKRKMGECICDNCGVNFEKPLSEIKRNNELNRKNFCTRHCVGKYHIDKIISYQSKYNITKHSNNSRDEYTGFRNILKRVKNRNYEYDIDLVYLKNLWDENNICVYTGVKLELPKYSGVNNQLTTASLDRIDSSKGYNKGNVQFISIAANHAKNNLSHEEMIKFCDLIYENKKSLLN